MVKKGRKEWDSIMVEKYVKNKLQEYKKRKKYHSDGETIEMLLQAVDN